MTQWGQETWPKATDAQQQIVGVQQTYWRPVVPVGMARTQWIWWYPTGATKLRCMVLGTGCSVRQRCWRSCLNKEVVAGDTLVKSVFLLFFAHLFPQSGGKPGVTQVTQIKYEIHYLTQLILNTCLRSNITKILGEKM